MLTARPGNADRFVIGGIAGLTVAWACLAAGHSFDPFPIPLMIGAAIGTALCMVFGFGLTAGVNRIRALAYETNRDQRIDASKHLQRGSAYGSLLMFAGISLQGAHSMLGVPQIPGQWIIALLFLASGLIVSMSAQARYLNKSAR